MVIRSLSAPLDVGALHAVFLEAFSDYAVPLRHTPEQFAEVLTRRGFVPELSCVIEEDGRLVAFTLNGFEETTAYDSGTGVVPSHRRRGFGRQMMEFLTPRLRDAGAKRYVLEVLESNVKAIALYESTGFTRTRTLQCWMLETLGEAGAFDDVRPHSAWFDVEPSWQNSIRSIERARDAHLVLGNDDGFVVVFPSTGDVPLLAVRGEARRRGLGTRLVHAAAAAAGKPLKFINVDTRDAGIAAFLTRLGAKHTVAQYEMELAL